jgi:hypothetical protein
MVEFKIKLEESIVQTFGYKEVEQYLQDFVKIMLMREAAKDILEDLKSIDLQNDKEWKTARHLAWQQEKHKYIIVK